jgi:hypothetical protein
MRSRPSHPAPTFGDDWPNAPLAEAGWRQTIMIFRKTEGNYFSQKRKFRLTAQANQLRQTAFWF